MNEEINNGTINMRYNYKKKFPKERIFYFPIWDIKRWPTLTDGVLKIIQSISSYGPVSWPFKKDTLKNRRIEVYKNLDNAIQEGKSRLTDDECFRIVKLEFDYDGIDAKISLLCEEHYKPATINITIKDLNILD